MPEHVRQRKGCVCVFVFVCDQEEQKDFLSFLEATRGTGSSETAEGKVQRATLTEGGGDGIRIPGNKNRRKKETRKTLELKE